LLIDVEMLSCYYSFRALSTRCLSPFGTWLI
jgi:hypothetical protein